MSDYIIATTVFVEDGGMVGFVSKGRKNYTVYATNQPTPYANPFDSKQLHKLFCTPDLLIAMETLHDFVVEKYAVPFSMRINVDVWWGGFQCTTYIREFDVAGKMLDGYYSKYGFKYYHNGGHLAKSDFCHPCLLVG